MAARNRNIHKSFENLKIKDSKIINILLLGETGVGKSTFINAFANYLSFRDLQKAEKEKLEVLIPAKIHIIDKNNDEHTVELLRKSGNQTEVLEDGASATQDVKPYIFPLITKNGIIRIRLIDTPGLGDTRGHKQDQTHCEHILSYIEKLKEIHALCFLFNSNTSRITINFEYCFKEILSYLDKSAVENILFVFTRATNFSSIESHACVKKLVEEINESSNSKIPLHVKNVFKFENDSFRYLAALQDKIEFEEHYRQTCCENWTKSAEECKRLISYVVGEDDNTPLKPHQVGGAESVNVARNEINTLSQPLADLTEQIENKNYTIQKHKLSLQSKRDSLKKIKESSVLLFTDVVKDETQHPILVCASHKCVEVYNVLSVNRTHFKTICHDPCFCVTVSDKNEEIVGVPAVVNCQIINKSNISCLNCSCDYSSHMFVRYKTRLVNETSFDQDTKEKISAKEREVKQFEESIKNLQVDIKKYERERLVIFQYVTHLVSCLNENAVIPFNTSCEEYLNYWIQTVEYHGDSGDAEELKKLLKQHKETKALVSLENVAGVEKVSLEKLWSLPFCGKKIKALLELQSSLMSKEYTYIEYTHKKLGKWFSEKDKGKEHNKNKRYEQNKDSKQKEKNKFEGSQKRSKSKKRSRSKSVQNSDNIPPLLPQTPPPQGSFGRGAPPYSAVNPPMPNPYYSQPPHTGHTPYYQDNAGYRPNNPPQASHRPPPDPRIEVKIVTDSSDRGQSSSYPQEQPQHNYPQQQGYGPNSPYYIPPHTNQPSNYPPNYPSHGPPNYPPHGQPNYPPHGQPNYPQHGPPNYPQHGPSGYGNYGPNYGPQGKYYGPNQPRGGRGNYQGPYRSDRGGRGTSNTRPRPNKFKNERKKPKGSKKSNKSSDSDDSSSSGN